MNFKFKFNIIPIRKTQSLFLKCLYIDFTNMFIFISITTFSVNKNSLNLLYRSSKYANISFFNTFFTTVFQKDILSKLTIYWFLAKLLRTLV